MELASQVQIPIKSVKFASHLEKTGFSSFGWQLAEKDNSELKICEGHRENRLNFFFFLALMIESSKIETDLNVPS